jgi:hypothetical protein
MGPKPKTKTAAGGIKVSSTSKAVDDFLAQSTVPAGSLQIAENKKQLAEKQKELTAKYLEL